MTLTKHSYACPHHCFEKLLYDVIVGKDTDILNRFGWGGVYLFLKKNNTQPFTELVAVVLKSGIFFNSCLVPFFLYAVDVRGASSVC